MKVSSNEAKEALADIQKITEKTRHSVASSGAYIFLIITGVVWLVGFVSTQFLSGAIVPVIWISVSILGSAVSILIGSRKGKRVRGPSAAPTARRAAFFWRSWSSTALPPSPSPDPPKGNR